LVIKEAEHSSGRRTWECKCDCGIIKIIVQGKIVGNKTKSCGCLNIELRKARGHLIHILTIKYSHPSMTTAACVYRRRYKEKDGISFKDFYDMSQKDCFYCGSEPNNRQNSQKDDPNASQFAKDNGEFVYNGLDRIDSNLGHTLQNCVPCCKICNWAKSDHSIDDFKKWVKVAYDFMIFKRTSFIETVD
jgi:hypothetical protein